MLFFFRKRENKEICVFVKSVLGFSPKHTDLFHTAFIHRSSSASFKGHRVNNERLEYLGDAVLSAVVADFLYRKYPYQGEGFLTEMRSKIVSRASLNKLAKKIGLLDMIDYQRNSQGGFKSIGGDAFEALVGAVYLEKGYKCTRRIIIDRILCTHLDVDSIATTDWNYKSKLIDWGQKNHKKVSFEVIRSFTEGHSSRRQYECQVNIDGVPQKSAVDFSIKAAEQLAAEKTYKEIVAQTVNEKE